MAQHIKIENFKEESWFKDVFGEITKALENTIGKKGKYFSIYDNQCDVFFHGGRNSKTKAEAVADIFEFFEDNYICGCGTEHIEYGSKCEDCGESPDKYMDNQIKHSQKDPEAYIASNEAKIVEHDMKIFDSDDAEMEDMNIPMENGLKAQEGLTMFPDDRIEGAKAFGFHSKKETKIASDEDLRLCDVGFEIHVGKETQIYLVA